MHGKVIDRSVKTLQETAYEMIEARKMDTQEFRDMVKFWGPEKLERLWAQEKALRENVSRSTENQSPLPNLQQTSR